MQGGNGPLRGMSGCSAACVGDRSSLRHPSRSPASWRIAGPAGPDPTTGEGFPPDPGQNPPRSTIGGGLWGAAGVVQGVVPGVVHGSTTTHRLAMVEGCTRSPAAGDVHRDIPHGLGWTGESDLSNQVALPTPARQPSRAVIARRFRAPAAHRGRVETNDHPHIEQESRISHEMVPYPLRCKGRTGHFVGCPFERRCDRCVGGRCPGRDSNPYALRPRGLSSLRLPFRHPGSHARALRLQLPGRARAKTGGGLRPRWRGHL
jgi:hypothetical protein